MTTIAIGSAGLAAAAGAAAVAGAVGLGLAGLAALAGGGRRRRGRRFGRRRHGREAQGGEQEALEKVLQVIREEDVSGCGRRMVCHLAASDPNQLQMEHLAVLNLLQPGEGVLPGGATAEYLEAFGAGSTGVDCTLAYPTCPLSGPQIAQQVLDYLP